MAQRNPHPTSAKSRDKNARHNNATNHATNPGVMKSVIKSLRAAGLKLTPPRLTILQQLLSASQENDHNVTPEMLHQKIAANNPRAISLATIYRTLKVLEAKKIVLRHDFHNQKPHYEINIKSHHDHLIDVKSGRVIEFYDQELELLQEKIIARLGYEIIDHRLEIYAKPIKKNN
ncbi:MAG: Fur family transcriptional regulator [Hydrotalea sp.]|nr:Fur family transcriptional regulator [Hydrotalea sp.]